MTNEKIARINELARKSRAQGLTEQERAEQAALRREYIDAMKRSLKVQLDSHTEILHANDSVYYDSSHGHGMIAIDGEDCEFLAIVIGE